MNRKRRAKRDRQLEELYKTLPTIKCKGLCQESCGPIAMSLDERDRMVEVSGSQPTVNKDLVCSYLKDGKCSIYKVRPAICRMFGTGQDLDCPFGCKPSRYLTKEEGLAFLKKLEKIAGGSVTNFTGQHVEDFFSKHEFRKIKK